MRLLTGEIGKVLVKGNALGRSTSLGDSERDCKDGVLDERWRGSKCVRIGSRVSTIDGEGISGVYGAAGRRASAEAARFSHRGVAEKGGNWQERGGTGGIRTAPTLLLLSVPSTSFILLSMASCWVGSMPLRAGRSMDSTFLTALSTPLPM